MPIRDLSGNGVVDDVGASTPGYVSEELEELSDLLDTNEGALEIANAAYAIPGLTGAVARSQAERDLDFVSIKELGAIGDGATSDTAAWIKARDCGATTIFVPDGTYLITFGSTTRLTVAGQTWRFQSRNAIIKFAPASTEGIAVRADRISLLGGAVDGNRANIVAATVPAILVGGFIAPSFDTVDPTLAEDCVIDMEVLSAKGVGLVVASHGCQVPRFRSTNTADNGLVVGYYTLATGHTTVERVFLGDIEVDRSTETDGYLQGGIKILTALLSTTHRIVGLRALSLKAKLPDPTEVVPTSVAGNVGVEIWRLKDCTLGQIDTFGGWIALSLGFAFDNVAIGAVNGRRGLSKGWEITQLGESMKKLTITELLYDGEDVTRRAHEGSCDDVVIGILRSLRAGVADGADRGAIIYLTGGTSPGMRISTLVATMGTDTLGAAIHIAGGSFGVGHIDLDCNGCARGIRSLGVDGIVLGSGRIYNAAASTGIGASVSGSTADHLDYNVWMDTPVLSEVFSGGAFGINCRISKFLRSTWWCRSLDVAGDVIEAYGTGTPEGVLAAGIGSTARRKDGSTSTTLYVKTSGTGNTGWTAK